MRHQRCADAACYGVILGYGHLEDAAKRRKGPPPPSLDGWLDHWAATGDRRLQKIADALAPFTDDEWDALERSGRSIVVSYDLAVQLRRIAEARLARQDFQLMLTANDLEDAARARVDIEHRQWAEDGRDNLDDYRRYGGDI